MGSSSWEKKKREGNSAKVVQCVHPRKRTLRRPWGLKVWTLKRSCNRDAFLKYLPLNTRDLEWDLEPEQRKGRRKAQGSEVVEQLGKGWEGWSLLSPGKLKLPAGEASCRHGWRAGDWAELGGLPCRAAGLHGRDWRHGQAGRATCLPHALPTEFLIFIILTTGEATWNIR